MSDCDPEHLEAGWPVLARGRVVDEEEDTDVTPHEWRGGEMTLSECQAECNAQSTCMGIEFDDASDMTDNHPGVADCVLIKGASTFVDCVAVHGAACTGFTIYGKPAAEGWGIIALGRVIDPDEANDISPHEWRGDTVGGGLGEKTLIECQAECNLQITCFGIEFAESDVEDNTPGFADCILISSASELVDCTGVHGAACDGWTIYARPTGRAATAWTFMRTGRVVDAEECEGNVSSPSHCVLKNVPDI